MAESTEETGRERREALQYWGYLIQPNKHATDKLDRLLRGIANYVVSSRCISDSDTVQT